MLLKLKGAGNHYSGQEEWWEAPSCERRYSDSATVDISGTNAHMCSGDPFPGPPPSECVDMARVTKFPYPERRQWSAGEAGRSDVRRDD